MPKLPPVRETAESLEIDESKGDWPFIRMIRMEDGSLYVGIDANNAGIAVGRAEHTAAIVLSPKKAARICRFIERTDPA